MVDGHVHLDDPGRADWEGWDTGTAALAAGGVTCCADMPLNSLPPTLDGAAFDAKVAAARGRARVDFALWGGLVPGNLAGLDELAGRGVVGFKAFMCPSGVPEFAHVAPDELQRGMERAAALRLPVAVHAEDPAVLAADAGRRRADDARLVRVAPGRRGGLGRPDRPRPGPRDRLRRPPGPPVEPGGGRPGRRGARGRRRRDVRGLPAPPGARRAATGPPSAPRPSARRRYDRPPSGRACGRGSPAARSTWWARTTRPGRRS